MKAASLKEIKTEIELLTHEELIAVCVRLSKFKKENKELITYILFDEKDEEGYIQSVKNEIDGAFESLNINSIYIAKKNIRKIIRIANRYIKYSGQNTTESALLIYVCTKIIESGLSIDKSQALMNIYKGLLKKINSAVGSMHEDLQYDYRKEIDYITSILN